MGFIETNCAEHKNLLHHQLVAAAAKLTQGAVVLGERHNVPYARAVVLDLITEGCVTKLFLELPDLSMKNLSMLGVSGEGYVSDYLQAKAKDNTDLTGDTVWEAFKALSRFIFKKHDNVIDVYTVIQHAVAHGVKVYFYDRLKVDKPGAPEGMQLRNEDMGKIFCTNAAADEPGVVLLIGVSHLHPTASGKVYDHTVQAQCKIGFFQVIDLSLLKPSELRALNKA
jgi:hypothetical protein